MAKQTIYIPPIVLQWSPWFAWDDIKTDARRGGVIVATEAGVYEAKRVDAESRLTIGKGANLRNRVKQGLVRGTTPHSTGKRIRRAEDTTRIVVRWAVTDRPAAAEEELHRRHKRRFGRLPKHTKVT